MATSKRSQRCRERQKGKKAKAEGKEKEAAVEETPKAEELPEPDLPKSRQKDYRYIPERKNRCEALQSAQDRKLR